MDSSPRAAPTRIRLSTERRANLISSVQRYCDDRFDASLSEFRAAALLDFFVRELGPAVYNQGVRDACAAMQEKLVDLEGEVYETDR